VRFAVHVPARVSEPERRLVSLLHRESKRASRAKASRHGLEHLTQISEIDQRVAGSDEVERRSVLTRKPFGDLGDFERVVKPGRLCPLHHLWRQVDASELPRAGSQVATGESG